MLEPRYATHMVVPSEVMLTGSVKVSEVLLSVLKSLSARHPKVLVTALPTGMV